MSLCFFFFNDTATTEIYTLSLHDALPISTSVVEAVSAGDVDPVGVQILSTEGMINRPKISDNDEFIVATEVGILRSEEHTSELQSRLHLVCRLLLEKKTILTIFSCSRCAT